MLLALPLHDEFVSSFVVSRFVSQRRLAPWRHRVISLDPPFTTAVRMIDRVHHDAAVSGTNTHMASPARFTDRDVLVVQIPDLTYRGVAIHIDEPHFAGWQFHMRIRAFLCDKLRCGSSTSGHLRTL